VPDTLAVEVNPDGMRTLSVPDRFETDRDFEIRLRNHAEGTHVYINLDDGLSTVAAIADTNHYVDANETKLVIVDVESGGSGAGELTVATGHGSVSERVPVEIRSRTKEKEPVTVDESLSQPPARESSGGLLSDDRVRALPAVVLGVVAVVLAAGTVLGSGTTALVLAGLAVLSGLLAAGYVAYGMN
jgi:hypothetical protein